MFDFHGDIPPLFLLTLRRDRLRVRDCQPGQFFIGHKWDPLRHAWIRWNGDIFTPELAETRRIEALAKAEADLACYVAAAATKETQQ